MTQNVDHLHHKAGSNHVIELHGSGYIVKCLNCSYEINRDDLQLELQKNNPDLTSDFLMIRPDGDVELSKVSSLYSKRESFNWSVREHHIYHNLS